MATGQKGSDRVEKKFSTIGKVSCAVKVNGVENVCAPKSFTVQGPATKTFCGDGKIQNLNDDGESETCDSGGTNGSIPGQCNATCNGKVPECGNGIKETGETCDEGAVGSGGKNGVEGHCNNTCDGIVPQAGSSWCNFGSTPTLLKTGESFKFNVKSSEAGGRFVCKTPEKTVGTNNSLPLNFFSSNKSFNKRTAINCTGSLNGKACISRNILVTECGDSKKEGAETCDDGSSNGQPGNCNNTCSGTVPDVTQQTTCNFGNTPSSVKVGQTFTLNINTNATNWNYSCPNQEGNSIASQNGLSGNLNLSRTVKSPMNIVCTTSIPNCSHSISVTDEPSSPICGNGKKESGETCDDGSSNGQTGKCNNTCSGTVPDKPKNSSCNFGSTPSSVKVGQTFNLNINTDATNWSYSCPNQDGNSIASQNGLSGSLNLPRTVKQEMNVKCTAHLSSGGKCTHRIKITEEDIPVEPSKPSKPRKPSATCRIRPAGHISAGQDKTLFTWASFNASKISLTCYYEDTTEIVLRTLEGPGEFSAKNLTRGGLIRCNMTAYGNYGYKSGHCTNYIYVQSPKNSSIKVEKWDMNPEDSDGEIGTEKFASNDSQAINLGKKAQFRVEITNTGETSFDITPRVKESLQINDSESPGCNYENRSQWKNFTMDGRPSILTHSYDWKTNAFVWNGNIILGPGESFSYTCESPKVSYSTFPGGIGNIKVMMNSNGYTAEDKDTSRVIVGKSYPEIEMHHFDMANFQTNKKRDQDGIMLNDSQTIYPGGEAVFATGIKNIGNTSFKNMEVIDPKAPNCQMKKDLIPQSNRMPDTWELIGGVKGNGDDLFDPGEEFYFVCGRPDVEKGTFSGNQNEITVRVFTEKGEVVEKKDTTEILVVEPPIGLYEEPLKSFDCNDSENKPYAGAWTNKAVTCDLQISSQNYTYMPDVNLELVSTQGVESGYKDVWKRQEEKAMNQDNITEDHDFAKDQARNYNMRGTVKTNFTEKELNINESMVIKIDTIAPAIKENTKKEKIIKIKKEGSSSFTELGLGKKIKLTKGPIDIEMNINLDPANEIGVRSFASPINWGDSSVTLEKPSGLLSNPTITSNGDFELPKSIFNEIGDYKLSFVIKDEAGNVFDTGGNALTIEVLDIPSQTLTCEDADGNSYNATWTQGPVKCTYEAKTTQNNITHFDLESTSEGTGTEEIWSSSGVNSDKDITQSQNFTGEQNRDYNLGEILTVGTDIYGIDKDFTIKIDKTKPKKCTTSCFGGITNSPSGTPYIPAFDDITREANESFILGLNLEKPNPDTSSEYDLDNSTIEITGPAGIGIPTKELQNGALATGINFDASNGFVEISEDSAVFEKAGQYTVTLDIYDEAGNNYSGSFTVTIVPSELDPNNSDFEEESTTVSIDKKANNGDERIVTLKPRDRFENEIPLTKVSLAQSLGDGETGGTYDLTKKTTDATQLFLNGLRSRDLSDTAKKRVGIKALVPSVEVYYGEDNNGATLMITEPKSVDFTFSSPVVKPDGTSTSTENHTFQTDLTFSPWVESSLSIINPTPEGNGDVELYMEDEIEIQVANTKPSPPVFYQVILKGHAANGITFTDELLNGGAESTLAFPSGNNPQNISTHPVRIAGSAIEEAKIAFSSQVNITSGLYNIITPGGNFANDIGNGNYLFDPSTPTPPLNQNTISILRIEADVEGSVLSENASYGGVGTDKSNIIAVGGVSAKDVREEITKNAATLKRSLEPETSGNHTLLNDNTLDFSNKDFYYFQGDVTAKNAQIKGVGTILIEDGNFIIEGDLTYADANSSLGVILINSNFVDQTQGNIFVEDEVQKIVGTYYADGGLRARSEGNKSSRNATSTEQLLIEGTIFTHNTLGGSETVPKISPFQGENATEDQALKYDLHWLRRYPFGLNVTQKNTNCVKNTNNGTGCDRNKHATIIRPDGKVRNLTPPGFKNSFVLKDR